MPRRRRVVIVLSIVGGLVLAIVLYLAFGDLSRHKGRIEAFVAKKTGRPFAIDGAFELKVLPSVSVAAERVRLGNAEWGSAPQMVEVGRFSTEIGLWSLVSGPIDVRSLELGDVSVLLEKGKDGKGNWVLGEGKEPEEGQEDADSLDPGATEVPAVIRKGNLSSVRVTYRSARQAGPRRAPRDAHHRAGHGRPAGDLRQGPGRQVRDHVDGRGGSARRPLLGAGHAHGARGRGREAPARRQGRPGPPEPPRRRRPHPQDRARGRRHDAREPPPAGGRHRPPERRRPVEGQGRAHPAGRRREARGHRGERERHAPDTRPSRVGPALLGLGRGRGPSRVGLRRDGRARRSPRGRRARRVLEQGDQARRGQREVRRSGGKGRRQHPRGSRPGRRHHVRGHRREPVATP